MIYWFIQHKVHVVAGAYSIYAYFEWGLIFFDILFDAWSAIDFKNIDVLISGKGIQLENKTKSDVKTSNVPVVEGKK